MGITFPVDTLACDTVRIAAFQSNPAYNYERDLLNPDINFLEWIVKWVMSWLDKLLNHPFVQEYSWLFWSLVILVIVGLLTWFIYKRRPELFSHSRKGTLAYKVEEDTIYGVDFELRITEAFACSDYKKCVRLIYLQTLKELNDEHRLEWQLYKTPSQYVYEVNMPLFKQLTQLFLRVRYGNYDVVSEDVDWAKKSQQKVMKGEGDEK